MRSCALLVLVAACSSPTPPARTAPVDPTGPSDDPSRDSIPIVDSHVHLAFYPVAEQLGEHGVRAVVDLASPERALGTKYPIAVIRSGPMLTHPNGYPLDAWGSDGYGIGCDSTDCVTTTIDRLKREGAGIIKVALDDDGLAAELVPVAVNIAHDRRMKVVVHALSNASAFRAGQAGADVLAHTPVEALEPETVRAWSGRAVISTLAAFGGSPSAVENLRKLRAARVTVLYGTDLGNLRVDGPSTEEMELMKRAGMTDDEVRASMTTVPWHFWGFDAIQAQ